MLQYIFLAGLTAFAANAQDIIDTLATENSETMVFGEAKNADGTLNEVLVEQPQNAANPLGAPIPDYSDNAMQNNKAVVMQPPINNQHMPTGVLQDSEQNPADSQMTPAQMNNEIQNKLYQEGNRIYDVQSYPADDLKTINQNGQDEAVTNYPAY